jgi:2Fe-2S ferredoxin
MVKINFKYQNSDEVITIDAPEGISLLEVAHQNNIELEGACEGSLACSTCHIIIEPDFYEKLNPASDDEEDMLDLAFGLTHTSRLGCQILVEKKLDGMNIIVPSTTRNIMVDKK